MTENETPLACTEDEKIISDFPKKQTKRIFITLSAFFVVIGLITFVVLSYGSSSQTILKDSKTNYIKAIYDCPGNKERCNFYYPRFSSISSITIDGKSVPVKCYYKFENPGFREVIIEFNEKLKDVEFLFFYIYYLISVDFSNFDTSELTNMRGLFSGCTRLKNVNWGPNFSTSKVTHMGEVFFLCDKLESIDLSNFNTAKVQYFNLMFKFCSSLKELDVSSFDTSSAIALAEMFYGCSSLTSIDISNFRTSKVEEIEYMFYGCSSLKTINFGDKFDTSNVNGMWRMFEDCSSLETLDLSSFNTTAVKSTSSLFENCDNLVSIKLNFTFKNLISSDRMFYNCRKLKKINLNEIVAKNLEYVSDMFFNCNSLTSIDISNLMAEKIEDTVKIFYNLPNTGNLTYNSLKLNPNFLVTLPSGWTKIDVKFSK